MIKQGRLVDFAYLVYVLAIVTDRWVGLASHGHQIETRQLHSSGLHNPVLYALLPSEWGSSMSIYPLTSFPRLHELQDCVPSLRNTSNEHAMIFYALQKTNIRRPPEI
jgi:hypothetical protein